ncbi:MAG: FTR1 family protein [Alphaproteobacteria bacterium]|nr:FTR1 family protein [Alphaproteobacteria bacterium]
MLATALIVFREVLEAALIVTIIMAATRGVRMRGVWISLGIAGGVAGAATVAAFMSFIANGFNGAGQDIVDAGILFLAVALICWHIVWMNSHGREIAAQMREVGENISEGKKHMSVLAVVVGLAVMREGSEIVLMLQGLWAGSGGATATMMLGAALGLLGGVATGTLMYLGLLALPLARVFSLTNGLLMLIAAGMAAHGANFLVQADLVPSLGTQLWNSSSIISDHSALGQVLAALIGYVARPSGIEIAFYLATVASVLLFMRLSRRAACRAGK